VHVLVLTIEWSYYVHGTNTIISSNNSCLLPPSFLKQYINGFQSLHKETSYTDQSITFITPFFLHNTLTLNLHLGKTGNTNWDYK